ncbi:MAG: glutamate--tRNA ligase, partial [Planctomycetes bacterium]|nr:glutamate--tRNA ligase [Planctomycetota bacterium]
MAFNGPVRVRIAPSPTGDPHVGTAYMGLFNRACADKFGGQFIFRLDDTDQKRRNEKSEAMLIEALRWLNLKYDEGPDIGGPYKPYRQSERLDIYKRYADKLLNDGHAYYCFCTEERLDSVRKIAAKEGKQTGYDRKCRDIPLADAKKRLATEKHVIRAKMPLSGEIAFDDLLRGRVSFPAADLDDKVILKADGFPTYHLANVVDDMEFKITHIFRGEEWLSSVPFHVILAQGLGVKLPAMTHMSLLRNADKSKVSKRKNPTNLLWFRDAGFLPEGVLNFLGLMSYSLANDQEIFTYDEFVKQFDPTRIGTGGPVFDLQKFEWLNGEHVRRLSDEEFEKRLIAHIKHLAGREAEFQPLPADDPAYQLGTFADKFRIKTLERNLVIAKLGEKWLKQPDVIGKLVPHIKGRAHTLSEAAEYLPPFFEEVPPLPVADIAEIKPGDAVLVLGCGPVGQLAIASAKLHDAGRIFAVDTIAS